MKLQDKIVLITGGAVRVGREITREIAQTGARVVCHYNHHKDEAIQLQQELETQGFPIYITKADLSDISSCEMLISNIINQFGRIDVLINNAAIFYRTPLGTVTEKQWDQLFTLNLKAVFFLSQAAGELMQRQQRGKIINIGDAGVENPWPSYIPYSLTKVGVIALTKGLAKALAPHVQVNCVNPGPVLFPPGMSEEEQNFAVQQTVLKKSGSPQDIARTVRFLLEGSDYITGAIIPVDGGRSIR